MKEIAKIKKRKIVIDTNCLVYCGDKKLGSKFKLILRKLKDNENEIAVSAISGFEIIKKFYKKTAVIDYYIKLLNYIKNVPVGQSILNNAAKMGASIYSNKEKDDYSKHNDLIIGSTALTHQALLLTCDRKDFSLPYWKIVARDCIEYEEDEKRKIKNVFLLEPDMDELTKKLKELSKN